MSTNRYDFAPPPLDPLDRAATRLLYASEARYSAEWNSLLHTHPCAEVFIVTGGEGFLGLAGHQEPIRANDTIIVNPNVEHTELSGSEKPLEYVVLGVDGMGMVRDDGGAGYSIVNVGAGGAPLQALFRTLLRELQQRRPGYDIICQDLLEVILITLMRRSEYTIRFVASTRRASKECVLVHDYIDDHYKEKLTLDDLAAVAHVSKFYLSHAFQREYGVSPISYLLDRRIRESLYLLAETRLTLAEIAGLLGFSSPSYFSQSFRRIQGTTPMAYRSAHRRQPEGEC